MLRKDTVDSPIVCRLLCRNVYAHYPVVSHTVAHKNARSDREIPLLLGSSCCANMCFRKLSFMVVKSSEEWATQTSGSEMRSWIISYLEQHAKEGGSPVFFIHGIKVCKVCWMRTYYIKYDRLRKVMKDFRNGVKVYHHGNKGKRQLRAKASSTMAWMKFCYWGNRRPAAWQQQDAPAIMLYTHFSVSEDESGARAIQRGMCVSDTFLSNVEWTLQPCDYSKGESLQRSGNAYILCRFFLLLIFCERTLSAITEMHQDITVMMTRCVCRYFGKLPNNAISRNYKFESFATILILGFVKMSSHSQWSSQCWCIIMPHDWALQHYVMDGLSFERSTSNQQFLIYTAEYPQNVPLLVEPTLAKQELLGLQRDIPLFFRHMSYPAQGTWRAILADPNNLLLKPHNPSWPLESILDAERPPVDDAEALSIQRTRERYEAPLNEVGATVLFFSQQIYNYNRVIIFKSPLQLTRNITSHSMENLLFIA